MTDVAATKKGSFALFADMPVKAKIMAGFALVLAILAILGTTGFTSFRSVGTNFATYETSVDIAQTGLGIGRGTLNMRRNVREFALTGDDKDAEVAREYETKVIELIERLLAAATDPQVVDKARELEALVKDYGTGFERVVELKGEDEALTGELATIGGEVTEELKTLVKDASATGNSNAMIVGQAALREFMELRLNVVKATGGGEQAAAAQEKVTEELAGVEAAITGLAKASAGSALSEKVEALGASVASYHETFTKLEAIDHELTGLIDGTMAEAGKGITERIDWLDAYGTESETAIKAEVDSTVETARTTMLALGVGGIVLGLAFAWIIGGAIAKPIAQATDVVEKLAAGDDNVEIAATARKDEIGRLWRAMAALKATVTEAFRLKTMVDEMPINVMTCDTRNDFKIDYANKTTKTNIKALEKLLPIRAEDLIGTSIDVFHKNPEHQRRILSNPSNLPYNATIRLGEEALELKVSAIRDGKGDYIGPMLTWTIVTEQLKLAGNVKEVVGLVASASTEMRSTAESMSATAEETGRQATSVAAASEQASANVQTVASAAEQLSASIAEISWQVAQSTKIAQEAVVQAGTANERIKGLADASQRIGEVVGVISDIASQTNLLALNATIEAARAGEAGKGFAVIASEVKSLATQTAKATEEIAAQIGTIQTAIGESVSVIKAIGGTIAEVNQIAATIATAVEQQGAATNEISRNVQEASRGTAEVSSNVAGVNQAASETGQAASQVLLAASELATQANKLGGEVEKFMARIGAAA